MNLNQRVELLLQGEHKQLRDLLPIVDEDYYFACERSRLSAQPVAAALAVLRSDDFRAGVAGLEGYDPTHCGAIVDVAAGLRGAPL